LPVTTTTNVITTGYRAHKTLAQRRDERLAIDQPVRIAKQTCTEGTAA
jgi:hypothetical protein